MIPKAATGIAKWECAALSHRPPEPENPLCEVAESKDLQSLCIVPKSPHRESETPLRLGDDPDSTEGELDTTELYIPLPSQFQQ